MSSIAKIGLSLLFIGLLLFAYIFFPAAKAEVEYVVSPPKLETVVDNNFGIMIPKIGANARVVPDVDPYNPVEYQLALSKGIAQARGTKWFLFAHSAGSMLEANRYNAVFYLLSKLEAGDEIDLYYKEKESVYKVTDKKVVAAGEINYMTANQDGQTLTLMTCWPPGTTFKRLLVISKLETK